MAFTVATALMVQRWTSPAMVQSYRETFAWFRDHHIRLIVVGPFPEYENPLPLLLAEAIRKGDMSSVTKRQRAFVPVLDRWMAAHADEFSYSYLSAYEVFCRGNAPCQVFTDKAQTIPVLMDNDHLTPQGAEIAARAWIQAGLLL